MRLRIPDLATQRTFWNRWNKRVRENREVDVISQARGAFVLDALQRYAPKPATIADLGCGTGWLSAALAKHGEVTAVDLADEVIAHAQQRNPEVRFIAGDLTSMTLPDAPYHVVVCVETLSHVPDQATFVDRVADWLIPGGLLILTTQNRRVFARTSGVTPLQVGQIRHWLTPPELRRLLARSFDIEQFTTMLPEGDRGFLRVVNSTKVNRLLQLVWAEETIQAAKERAGLGQSIAVVARRRS